MDIAVKEDGGAGEARSFSGMNAMCQPKALFAGEEGAFFTLAEDKPALGVAGDARMAGLAWWLYAVSLKNWCLFEKVINLLVKQQLKILSGLAGCASRGVLESLALQKTELVRIKRTRKNLTSKSWVCQVLFKDAVKS